MKLLLDNRVYIIQIFTCLFFIIGILMSFPLWTADRTFPLCPVFDEIPQFTSDLSVIVVIALIILMFLGAIFRHRLIFIITLVVMFFLLLQDQMRWQPWVYLYCFLLFPFVLKAKRSDFVPYFQLLIIGIYLWGGLHKFSPDFIDFTYSKILRELFRVENQDTILNLRWFGYSIPTIEVLIALLLVFPKTRLAGIIGALLTHAFILIYLIKIEYNTIVYPWNIAMAILVLVLFFRNLNSLKIWKGCNRQVKFLNSIAITFFLIMPVFCLFNLWDNYLSFRLYSGKTNLFFVTVSDDEIDKIDGELHAYFWQVERLTGGEMISLNKWAVEELNVPFYPETRVFKQVTKSFCGLGIENDKLISVEFERSFGEGEYQAFKCSDLP